MADGPAAAVAVAAAAVAGVIPFEYQRNTKRRHSS